MALVASKDKKRRVDDEESIRKQSRQTKQGNATLSNYQPEPSLSIFFQYNDYDLNVKDFMVQFYPTERTIMTPLKLFL
jgi:hypothetical protein